MRDFNRDERTTTVVRHSMTTPVNWRDMERLISAALRDMGSERAPADDELWIEATDEEIAVCYELQQSTAR